MKISFNNKSHKINQPSQPFQAKHNNDGAEAPKTPKSFDTVSIQSNPSITAERKFAASLSSEIISQVRQPSSPDKVYSLQEKVTLGEYRPDPEKIASRILLSGEDE